MFSACTSNEMDNQPAEKWTSPRCRGVIASALACWLFVTIGCGGGDPSRCDLSGSVSFQGKPVPAGSITFEPDVSQGSHGPQGFSGISNGRYDTSESGKPVPFGRVIVRVVGFDGSTAAADSDGQFSPGRPLFPTYTTHLDVSKQSATFDFEIPAQRP